MSRPRLLAVCLDDGGPADACHAFAEAAGIEARVVTGPPPSPARLVDLARRIEDAHAEGMAGTVVLLNRDTLEEAAFVLDLLVGGDRPVVAAVAPMGEEQGADLVAALRVAAAPAARGLGALVVAEGAVHAARYAERGWTGARDGFVSPLRGVVGSAFGSEVHITARPRRLPVQTIHGGPPRPVALLRWAMGDDGRRLGALPALGFAGAVVEVTGPGQVAAGAAPMLGDLAARMPVVLACHDRGASGGDARLTGRGLIASGCLSALKAGLLLGFALRGGAGQAAASGAFAPYADAPHRAPVVAWPAVPPAPLPKPDRRRSATASPGRRPH